MILISFRKRRRKGNLYLENTQDIVILNTISKGSYHDKLELYLSNSTIYFSCIKHDKKFIYI